MSEREEWQRQEYEFIMDGITTRMQMAMEKISEANLKVSETNIRLINTIRSVCVIMLISIVIIISGFIVYNQIWIGHVDSLRKNAVVSEVAPDEAVSQFGPAEND